MKALRVLAILLLCLALSSCFKEEPLNAECDITQVSFQLENPLGTFFSLTDTLQTVNSTDNTVTFNVRRNHEANLETLQPRFVLTPGATLSKLGGEIDPIEGGRQTYRVTSEDGQWHRDYSLQLIPVVRTIEDTVAFDFEHFELEPQKQKYYIWHNLLPDGTLGNDWANGNPGFQLSMGSATPEQYPTVPLIEGFDGHAVQLTTRSTGPFGVLAGKRLAAGNFYLGTFNVTNALQYPLRATSFGVVFDREPITITGYYKYQPGRTYQDFNGNTVEGRTDQAAIYAVLYRNHDDKGNEVILHGDDVKSNPLIVAIADMADVPTKAEWTAFSLVFQYKSTIDYELLAERGYNLTLVFSSSSEGDKFEGAVGSQLCIDKVRVICKKEE